MKTKPKYRVLIDWSDEDKAFVARVPELDGVATHGDTYAAAAANADEAIRLHLRVLAEDGVDAPTPVAEEKFSGKLLIRAGSARHRSIVLEARRRGMSMNDFVCLMIDDLDRGHVSAVKPRPNSGKVARKPKKGA